MVCSLSRASSQRGDLRGERSPLWSSKLDYFMVVIKHLRECFKTPDIRKFLVHGMMVKILVHGIVLKVFLKNILIYLV